jgi:RNA polymerase-binding protein DksA
MTQQKALSSEELAYFKELLLKERERILFVLRHIESDSLNVNHKEKAGDLNHPSMHMADVATEAFDTDFRLGVASNEKHLLEEIDAALARIEEGTYGFCEKYGVPIPKARLKAMPYARYCIKAQEEEEAKRKLG